MFWSEKVYKRARNWKIKHLIWLPALEMNNKIDFEELSTSYDKK